jgi:hypothetical protein
MDLIFVFTTAMEKAKKFLRENLTESTTVAARLFNVNVKTLTAFIRRCNPLLIPRPFERRPTRYDYGSKKKKIERKSHVLKNQ